MLRRALKGINFYQMGVICVICGAPATDMHECFVNRGAVMQRIKDERREINSIYNVVPLCNHCNLNITHKGEVKARQAKLVSVGLEYVIECHANPGDYTDEQLMKYGADIVQSWIDELGLRAHQSVAALAELEVKDE